MTEDAKRSGLGFDGHTAAGIVVFLVMVVTQWWSQVGKHETLYLIGSRRIADPQFLANDFLWSKNLPPTTFLFDHLLAPLWPHFSEFAITNIGRFVVWVLTAWSLTALARSARIPAWCLAAGFTAWVLWGQTVNTCGAPLEGFQVKSFAYPMVFFALAFAMQGRVVAAGIAAGLGTAFHIIVGGWGCLAVFLALLVNRKAFFSWRALAIFLIATAPFIVPLLGSVALYNEGGVPADQRAAVDRFYVSFAVPWCGDFDYFLENADWMRIAFVFSMVAVLLSRWPKTREGSVFRAFVLALFAFFLVAQAAQRLELYSVLKVFPAQLGLSLPALFFFMVLPSFMAAGQPSKIFGRTGWALMLLGTTWLLLDRQVPVKAWKAPSRFMAELRRPVWGTPRENGELYDWVRTHTPPNSIFITPFLWDFWSHAERAQVASFRHAPLDRRQIEWRQRLEALIGFQPLTDPWDAEDDVEDNEARLSVSNLVKISELYGATHYLTAVPRADLADQLIFSTKEHWVYDITKLK